jgi:hypothetical protein
MKIKQLYIWMYNFVHVYMEADFPVLGAALAASTLPPPSLETGLERLR